MESSISQKLEALLKLQELDSKIDNLQKVRGDLPEEVRDLEDEIIGYDTRIKNFNQEIEIATEDISKHKQSIKNTEKLIKKYQEQQAGARNNREYDAISKEVELQQLEIQLLEKKSKEAQQIIEKKQLEIETIEKKLKDRKKDLKTKKEELQLITEESEEEESKLTKERAKQSKLVDERLYKSYEKTRSNVLNGLAVVTVKRGACGGCFNIVPPQRQSDIRDKKKITVCEHCGRILADVEDQIEQIVEKPKTKTRTKKEKTDKTEKTAKAVDKKK